MNLWRFVDILGYMFPTMMESDDILGCRDETRVRCFENGRRVFFRKGFEISTLRRSLFICLVGDFNFVIVRKIEFLVIFRNGGSNWWNDWEKILIQGYKSSWREFLLVVFYFSWFGKFLIILFLGIIWKIRMTDEILENLTIRR